MKIVLCILAFIALANNASSQLPCPSDSERLILMSCLEATIDRLEEGSNDYMNQFKLFFLKIDSLDSNSFTFSFSFVMSSNEAEKLNYAFSFKQVNEYYIVLETPTYDLDQYYTECLGFNLFTSEKRLRLAQSLYPSVLGFINFPYQVFHGKYENEKISFCNNDIN